MAGYLTHLLYDWLTSNMRHLMTVVMATTSGNSRSEPRKMLSLPHNQ